MSKIATRERILHAALEIFASEGYHRVMLTEAVPALTPMLRSIGARS